MITHNFYEVKTTNALSTKAFGFNQELVGNNLAIVCPKDKPFINEQFPFSTKTNSIPTNCKYWFEETETTNSFFYQVQNPNTKNWFKPKEVKLNGLACLFKPGLYKSVYIGNYVIGEISLLDKDNILKVVTHMPYISGINKLEKDIIEDLKRHNLEFDKQVLMHRFSYQDDWLRGISKNSFDALGSLRDQINLRENIQAKIKEYKLKVFR